MKTLHTITLEKTTGKKTIANAINVFTSYIDSDFKNWGTDKKGEKTKEMNLAVCELTENMTFAQMFPKPEEMSLSQEQIVDFCVNHKDKLRQDGYATFFLFKVDSEFFVAIVHVLSDGLNVHVRRLSLGHVWIAECRYRLVFPQLTLENLDQTLSPSESLTLESAIKLVKESGYQVSKIM